MGLGLRLAAAIGVSLGVQRVIAYRPDQGVILGGDDNDAGFRDGMPPPILLGVETDQRSTRNEDIAVDDRPPESSVATDANARHEDGPLDFTEAVNSHIRAQDASDDPTARDDAPA
jgi:hypothetical protein